MAINIHQFMSSMQEHWIALPIYIAKVVDEQPQPTMPLYSLVIQKEQNNIFPYLAKNKTKNIYKYWNFCIISNSKKRA